jgi:hypothetical protein
LDLENAGWMGRKENGAGEDTLNPEKEDWM